MQISRIIEFMQREQCENENEEIKFVLSHTNFVIDTMRKQYYRQNNSIRMYKRQLNAI